MPVPALLPCRVAFAAIATALVLAPSRAHAEGWMVDATAALGSGFEGGDPGPGSIEWHRARTRLIAGFDLRSDEAEQEGLGFRGFVELERRGGVGGEVRYSRWLSRGVAGFINGTAVLVPETLVGAGAGATFVIPFGKRAGFAVEPSFSALPFGSDVPDGTVVLWANLSLGLRLGL